MLLRYLKFHIVIANSECKNKLKTSNLNTLFFLHQIFEESFVRLLHHAANHKFQKELTTRISEKIILLVKLYRKKTTFLFLTLECNSPHMLRKNSQQLFLKTNIFVKTDTIQPKKRFVKMRFENKILIERSKLQKLKMQLL